MYKLPERLKHIRASKNLTQTQIASKLGMTYQEYQKIEAGKTVIRADKLFHICETLDISSDELLGLKGLEAQVIGFDGINKPATLKQESKIPRAGRVSGVKYIRKVKR